MNVHNSDTALNRIDIGQPHTTARIYNKTNSYTQKASYEQIFTVVIFAVITILHAVFVSSAAPAIQSSILWVIIVFTYGVLILLGYDYCYLTCGDPVDDLVLNVKKHYRED